MIKIICVLILLVSIFRFVIGRDKSVAKANMLLFSSLIQSLMSYPIMKTLLILKERILKMDFTSPVENAAGICFPTLLVCLFPLINGWRQNNCHIGSSRFLIGVLAISFVYSYLTPYNVSHTATTIALLVILQIMFTIYMCKIYVSGNIFVRGFFDAFQIIVVIELIVSSSFVLFHINTLQQMFIPELEGAVVEREGVSMLRASGTMGWPNRLGALLALIAVFFWICYLWKYKPKKALTLFVLSLIGIVLSQSRSALMACLLSAFGSTALLMYKRRSLTVRRILSICLILATGALLLFNLPVVQEMFFKSDTDEMSEARFIHYALGFEMAKDTGFLGTGINTNAHYMYYCMNSRILGNIWLYQHSIHCIHIIILVELGVVGLILWVWYLFSRIYRIFRTPLIRMNNPIIWFTFLSMLIIIIIHGFTDIMYMHYQYMLIISLFGMYSIKALKK